MKVEVRAGSAIHPAGLRAQWWCEYFSNHHWWKAHQWFGNVSTLTNGRYLLEDTASGAKLGLVKPYSFVWCPVDVVVRKPNNRVHLEHTTRKQPSAVNRKYNSKPLINSGAPVFCSTLVSIRPSTQCRRANRLIVFSIFRWLYGGENRQSSGGAKPPPPLPTRTQSLTFCQARRSDERIY